MTGETPYPKHLAIVSSVCLAVAFIVYRAGAFDGVLTPQPTLPQGDLFPSSKLMVLTKPDPKSSSSAAPVLLPGSKRTLLPNQLDQNHD
jgi:hypothetical protein